MLEVAEAFDVSDESSENDKPWRISSMAYLADATQAAPGVVVAPNMQGQLVCHRTGRRISESVACVADLYHAEDDEAVPQGASTDGVSRPSSAPNRIIATEADRCRALRVCSHTVAFSPTLAHRGHYAHYAQLDETPPPSEPSASN
jgi:hypothetical protein